MDDGVAVGEGDGVADGVEKPEPGGDIEPGGGCKIIDALAVDEFHDEIGAAVGGVPGVEECGDIGMFAERREDIDFVFESPGDAIGIEPASNELDCDILSEVGFADGEIDDAHSAAADLLDDAIFAADDGAFGEGEILGVGVVDDRRRGVGEGDGTVDRWKVFGLSERLRVGVDDAFPGRRRF